MNSALAAVFEGEAGRIAVRHFAIPRPTTGEMLVRVLGCTLCGSDLHSFEGRRQVPTPTILGHEIVGEIVEMGAGAAPIDLAGDALHVGDRVTWAIVANCNRCLMCEAGLPQKCLCAVKYGHEALRPGYELLGGLAEYCLLAQGTSVVRLPDRLPLEVACPASCATATMVAALESAGDVAGKSVLLFGAGMLGLTACALLRAQGAAQIVCIDPAAARRELALSFGATRTFSPEESRETLSQTAGELGFDVMLEVSGAAQAFEAGWPLIRTGGTLVLIGAVFPGAPVAISLEQIVRRNLTIRGVHNYAPRHLQRAVEFLAVHHEAAPFANLVSQWFPLSAAGEAFALSKQPHVIRVGVKPDMR